MKSFILFILFTPMILFCQYKIKDIPANKLNLLDSKNIVLSKNNSYVLKENTPDYTKDTDLLLNFTEDSKVNVKGNYYLQNDNLKVQYSSIKNRGGCVFYNWDQNLKVILKPKKGALFAENDILGDFTIDFWINPFLMRNGEKIFSYFDIFKINDITFQSFEIIFFEKKVVWNFSNILAEPVTTKDNKLKFNFIDNLKVESNHELTPHKWSHHMLRYSAKESKIEYLINGKIENVVSLKRNDTSLVFLMGKSQNGISIANDYNGLINNFRIIKKFLTNFSLDKYRNEESYALFGPIDLGKENEIVKILPKYSSPGKSKFEMRYMLSNNKNKNIFDDKDWMKVSDMDSNVKLKDYNRGRYVYIMMNYRNSDYINSPTLDNLSIYYYELILPPPPQGVMIEEKDEGLTIRWQKVPLTEVKGYMIFISDRPGNYLNSQRIDVGLKSEWTFSNLENEKTYYIVISSYSKLNEPANGLHLKRIYSKEYSATPSRFGDTILDM